MTKWQCMEAHPEHVLGISDLANATYPTTPGWPCEQLVEHQKIFAEGQHVVVEQGSNIVVGAMLSLIVEWPREGSMPGYMDLINEGWFGNHKPKSGDVLYGADLMVAPNYRRAGIGTLLLKAHLMTARRCGVRATRGSIPLRTDVDPNVTSVEGVKRLVLESGSTNPSLLFHERHGFYPIAVVLNHFEKSQCETSKALIVERATPRKER